MQLRHEDVIPQELQPELQLEQLPQQAEYERQQRLCLPKANAESAITSHTSNNTGSNMTIRRMTLPPKKWVTHYHISHGANAAQGNRSHPRSDRKVPRFFWEKSAESRKRKSKG